MELDKKILKELIKKYENSKSYEIIDNNRNIFLSTIKDKIFNNYFSTESYLYRDEYLDAINKLQENNLIKAIYDKESGLLKKVILNKDNINKSYEYLGLTPKRTLVLNNISALKEELLKYNINSVVYTYLKNMINLLENNKPHISYFEKIEEIFELSNIINSIENNTDEILLRNFSKKVTKNSKTIERKTSQIFRIFKEFSNYDFNSIDELLNYFNIVKNNSYSYIKNGIIFEINGEVIDLDKLSIDFSLSYKAIKELNIINITKKKVITIENLTTFNYYNDNDSIIIYLGGFHNSVKRLLIEKINNFNINLEWYHFGDIDCGGFEIFFDLVNKTSIAFKPLYMDIDTLKKYKDDCLPLTENDKKRLTLLLKNKENNFFTDVIEYMLENNYKLEQESIEFY